MRPDGWALPGIGPGDIVASRYRILEELGAGGMGVVFKARDEELDDTVALKVLRPDARLGAQAGRFRSEIRLARRIRHPNVCAIHEYGEEEGLLYISMELVDGRDLKRLLRENGPFHWEDGCRVALQIAAGLEAIHEAQVIHRDLKPANIMKDSKGLVRIMDFGIAKAWNPETGTDFTKTGHIVGSPEYMSPEQIRDATLDFRSDLYSFGVVLYEIFTGRLPFAAETPVEVMHMHLSEPPPLDSEAANRIPEALLPVLRKALAKDRADRYANAAEMRRALERARVDSPTPFVPIPGPLGVRPRPDVARLLVPHLLRALSHATAAVRRDGALALGSTESDSALVRSALEEARSDDDPGVRGAAVEALQKLPATAPAPPPAPQPDEPPKPRDPRSGEGTVVHPAPVVPSPPPPSPPQPAPPLLDPRPEKRGMDVAPRPPLRPRPAPPKGRGQLVRLVSIAAALVSPLVLAWWLNQRPRETPPVPTPTSAATPSSWPSQGPTLSPPESPPAPSPSAAPSVLLVPLPVQGEPPDRRKTVPVVTVSSGSTEVSSPPAATTTTTAPPLVTTMPSPTTTTTEPPDPKPPDPPSPSPQIVRLGDLVPWSDPKLQPPRSAVPLAAIPTPMVEHLALHGSVTLLVLVDEKGGVADLKVNRVVCRQRGGQDVAVFGAREIKEFEGILGEAAKRSVTRWRFAPATKLGVPVRVWMPVEMQF